MTEQKIEKPTSVTVFGILNCVFGALGLIGKPFGMFVEVTVVHKALQATAPYKAWTFISGFVGIGFTIWLLVLGIGLLMMKRWARGGSVIYAWVVIFWNFLGMVISIAAAVYLKWLTVPEASMPRFIVGMFVSMCGGLIYPTLLLNFMHTEKVKRAFAAIGK
jgi:hypothetical protein